MTTRGAGSVRGRSEGRWEVRVSLGPDPVSGRSRVASRTVHGDLAAAQAGRQALAAEATRIRAAQEGPPRTVAELLTVWLAAPHDWKPSTWHGYRTTGRRLNRDPLAARKLSRLSPPVMHAVIAAWSKAGIPASTQALNVRTLRSALGWAYEHRLVSSYPLDGLRGLPSPEPRRDVPVPVVAALLRAADDDLDFAHTGAQRHRAEQLRLLLHLAADTGARRGELAALRLDDLAGRRLRIERGLSDEVLTTTKTGRGRTLTLGTGTAQLWRDTVEQWHRRNGNQPFGPWLFALAPQHSRRRGAGGLGQLFSSFCHRHGHSEVTLHRLRHTVATVLVTDGLLLQAQQRLGHREASTTLRQYCHVLPLHDEDVADHLENRYARG